MALHIETMCSGGEVIKKYLPSGDLFGISQENENGTYNGVIFGCDQADRSSEVFLVEDMEFPMDAITLARWQELCIWENKIEYIPRGKDRTLTAEQLGFRNDADYKKIVVKHISSWFGICFGSAFKNDTPLEQGYLRDETCPDETAVHH
jgi:hypothetical protein